MSRKSALSIRPLREEDLVTLHQWLNTAHVLEWWSKETSTLEQVRERYLPRVRGEKPVRCFMACMDDAPFGYLQYFPTTYSSYYRDYPVSHVPTPIVELYIGDEANLHKGLGRLMLARFLDEVIFSAMPDLDICLINPNVDNTIAIRSYRHLGFVHVADLIDQDGEVYLMQVTREDFYAYYATITSE